MAAQKEDLRAAKMDLVKVDADWARRMGKLPDTRSIERKVDENIRKVTRKQEQHGKR
jgi:hypothetical protein